MNTEELKNLKAPLTITNKKTGEVIASFENRAEAYNQGYQTDLSLSSQKTAPVYKTPSGYTTKSPAASVSLDKTTGKITLQVPEDVKNSPYIKQYAEGLKNLSKAYKANPDYKYPIYKTNEETGEQEETGEYRNIDEQIKLLNGELEDKTNSLQAVVETVQNLHSDNDKIKTNIKMRYNAEGLDLTDEEMWKLATGIGVGAGRNDKSFQLIPNSPAFAAFRALDSYDAETGYAQIGDIKENLWNRDKVSDEFLKQTRNVVNNYFEEGDFSDRDEFIKMYAMYEFINGASPSTNWAQSTGEVIGNAGIANMITFVNDMTNFGGFIWNLTFDNVAGLFGEDVKEFLRYEGDNTPLDMFFDGADWLGKTLAGKETNGIDYRNEHVIDQYFDELSLNNAAAGAGIEVGEFIGFVEAAILETIITDKVLSMSFSGIAGLAGKVAAKIGGEAAVTGQAIGESTSTIASLMATGGTEGLTLANNFIQGARVIAQTAGGSKTLMNLYKFLSTASVGLEKFGQIVSGSTKLKGLAGGTQWLVNQAIDLLSDVACEQPDLLADWLTGNDLTDDEKSKLLQSVNNSLLGQAVFGAGFGVVGKGAKWVKSTHAYQAVNANWSRAWNKLSVAMGDLGDKIRLATVGKAKGVSTIDDYIATFKNPKKANIWTADQAVRDVQRTLAEAERVGIVKTAESEAALREFQLRSLELKNQYLARTQVKMEGAGIIKEWLYSAQHPKLSAAWKAVNDSTSAVIKAERELGLRGYSIKSGAGRTFSEETVDYIGAKGKMLFVDNYLASNPNSKNAAAAQKEKGILQEMIDKFLGVASPELQEAADKYIVDIKDFWFNFNEMRISEGLLSRDEIQANRDSLLWGDGGKDYMRTQRKSKETKGHWINNDGTVNRKTTGDIDKYELGAKEHFVDPYIIMVSEIQKSASQKSRLNFARNYVANQAIMASVTGADSKLLRQSKQIRQSKIQLNETIDANINGIVESFQQTNVIGDIFSGKKNAKVFSLPKNYNLPARRLKAVQAEIDDTKIGQLFEEYYGDRTINDVVVGSSKEDGSINFALLGEQTETVLKNEINAYYDAHSWSRPDTYTIDDYRNTVEYDSTVSAKTQRALILSNDDVIKSDTMKRLLTDQLNDSRKFNRETVYKNSTDKIRKALENLPEEYRKQLGDVDEFVEALFDDFVDQILDNNNVSLQISNIIKNANAANSDIAARYLILDSLRKDLNSSNGKLKKKLQAALHKNIPDVEGSKELENSIISLFKDVADAQSDAALNALRESGAELIDNGNFYQRTKEIREKIEGVKEADSFIAIPDLNGDIEYYIVDPAIASFINTAPTTEAMSGLQKANWLWCKAFRFGTTVINLGSMVKQNFTDTFSALVGGGMYQTIASSEQELTELFSQDIATFMGQYRPSELSGVLERAGVTAEEAVADRAAGRKVATEMARAEVQTGRVISPASTEFATYALSSEDRALRTIGRGKEASDRMLGVQGTISKVKDAIKNPNDIREQLLRSTIYANNFNQGIQSGMSIQQARIFAGFAQQEGTTNFWNASKHLSGISSWVPYFNAGLNGTKSFYRLASLDPMGVIGRLMTQAVIPTMALTAHSLADPENREIYQRLPEYMKAGNIVVVSHGKVFCIPVPDELAAFMNPFRQVVESMYGVQNYSFWELALNDLAAFSPVDITGFTDPDYNKLLGQNFGDKLGRGFSRTAAQIMPPGVRTALIWATGYDPYSGSKMDKTYGYFDWDTGTMETADKTSGQMAKAVAQATNDFITAPMAQVLLKNLFGTQIVAYGDFVINLAQLALGNEQAASWDKPLQDIVEGAFSSITDYDRKTRAEQAWVNAVSYMYDKKQELLVGDKWQSYLKMRRQATTEEQKQKVAATRKDITEEYFQQVKTMVENLNSEYGAEFTGYKLASVISLMTLNQGLSDASDEASKEIYHASRNQAIQTMVEMGFPNPTDASALGYIGADSTDYTGYTSKEVELSPLAFLDMEAKTKYSGTMYSNRLNTIIKSNNFSDKLDEVYKQINAVWDGSGTSKQKAAKANEIRKKWNKEFIMAIDEYMQTYTPEAVLSSTDAMNTLSQYILVPQDQETMGKAYKVSSSTGVGWSKQRAFARNYIKSIYGVK